MLINDIQGIILSHLGFYGYLTVSQLKRLTGKSLGYLRQQLAILSQRKLIHSYHVEVTAKVRAENIYHLTEAGKAVLFENDKIFTDIRVPIGKPLVVQDYSHRKAYQSLCIELVELFRSKGILLTLFASYFDKTGNNRKDANLSSKTKIALSENSFFMPDGVMITTFENKRSLYLLELYNGRDTIRVLQQLSKHTLAISKGTPGKTFDINANPFVLSSFEYEGCKDAVIKKLQQNERFTPMKQFFFFASQQDVLKDCVNAWRNITGDPLEFQ